VSIDLPSISDLRSGPVWYLETLEESSWSSIECSVSYSLKKALWMEVLCKDMVHEIRLLVELLAIEIFNTNTYNLSKYTIRVLEI
jgi:hypothetical protein